MAPRLTRHGRTWIGLVALGLVCLGVGMGSYSLGRHLLRGRIHEVSEVREGIPSTPAAEPEPATPEPSPTKITVVPKPPAEQTSGEPEKGAEVETETTPEGAAYAIQVGAFSSAERAKNIAEKLVEAGYAARVVKSAGEATPTYAVFAGRYEEKGAAQEALTDLKKKYPDAFLTRLEGPKG